MIINNWYVAAQSSDVTDAPFRTRMLGCDFVLFRDAAGEVVCLSDICCHRGASLSRGACSNGRVQCPYHGWEFGSTGQVELIPSLGPDARIPRRARVDCYPVEERYGLIWAFLGDMPDSARPELPELLPEYGDEDTWRMTRLQRDWDVHWGRLKENLADASHLFLVHSFGKHLSPEMQIFPVEETAWGVRIPQTYSQTPTRDSQVFENVPESDNKRPESSVLIEISVIGMIQKNTQLMASGYNQVIWNALTPIDDTRTRHFNLHFRNFQMDPKHDESMMKTIDWGLQEDAEVIDHLQPPLTPDNFTDELFIEPDGPEKAYREKALKLGRELGRIDWRRRQEMALEKALVIPSPARRDGGSWIHDTVPLLDD